MNNERFDILVRNKKGKALAIVEIRSYSKSGRSGLFYYNRGRETALQIKADFFVFVTPNKAHFWRIKDGQKVSFDFEHILSRYNEEDIPLEFISEDYMQAIAREWLLDLAEGRETDGEALKMLEKIGFYKRVQGGDAELELAA